MTSGAFRQFDELGEITVETNIHQANAILTSNALFGFPRNFRRDYYLECRESWNVWPKPPPAIKRRINGKILKYT